MIKKDLMEKKELTVYRAYHVSDKGQTLQLDSSNDKFYTSERAALEAYISDDMHNNTDKLFGIENTMTFVGNAPEGSFLDKYVSNPKFQILKISIYMNKIPQEDFENLIFQDGECISMPVGKYQKSMSISTVNIDELKSSPNKADPTRVKIDSLKFSKAD